MALTEDEVRELTDLWARRERLALGIGGWTITAASLPWTVETTEQHKEAAGHIWSLTEDALAVVARIRELEEKTR